MRAGFFRLIMKKQKALRKHTITQWTLLPIMIVVVGLGWIYPLMGYVVPVVMVAGIVWSFYNGRYVCGNLCPRGSFFDRLMAPISGKKPIPEIFRNPWFRWSALVLLMGFMFYRMALNPTDLNHIGYVFWQMCAITSVIGVVFAIGINARTWCSFCPIGTLQMAIGGGRDQMLIDPENCRGCRICEKACPMDLEIVSHKDSGHVNERDCLRCSKCIAVCPKDVLQWPSDDKAA